MSQAPGLSGTPVPGQVSSAARKASCASSSARPTSRTLRARPAMTLADSIFQTASIALCVADAVTAIDRSRLRLALLRFPLQLVAKALLTRAELRRKDLGRKIRHLLHLADLDRLVLRSGAALGPLDRLLPRLHLDHPVAAEHVLRLSEGPVGDLWLASGEGDARTHRRRMQALEREQHARLLQGFVVFHHRGDRLGIRKVPGAAF